jgi:flagellar capping protein FliD
MIKQHKSKAFALSLLSLALSITGCDDDESTNSASLAFEKSVVEVTEATATVRITLESTRALDADTEVSVDIGGNAYLNGDYKLKTSLPVIMEKGSTEAFIDIEIIDESILENIDDSITLRLQSVVNPESVTINTDRSITHVIITDNDLSQQDVLQIDLLWNLGEGKDIDEVDLDLYLATNVVIEDNQVIDAFIYNGSENSAGFESLSLTSTDQDDEYYIVVYYKEGSTSFEYSISLNGAGYENVVVTDQFTSSDSGYAVFFGPIMKSGNSFSRSKKNGLRTTLPTIKGQFRR